jgi:mannose-6-phosphate isomerase-like protein (cupin superfamily)
MPHQLADMFKHIKAQQNTVDVLLKSGVLGSAEAECFPKDMIGLLTMIYQKEDCSIGFVDYTKEVNKTDDSIPLHQHISSIHYIIVIKGSVLLKLINHKEITRVMKTGECAAIPPGLNHKTIPLEADTKIFFICIPQDYNYHAYLGRN